MTNEKSMNEEEYKIIPNPDSQTITVPYNQQVWVNNVLLSPGTYRIKSPSPVAGRTYTEEEVKAIKQVKYNDGYKDGWDDCLETYNISPREFEEERFRKNKNPKP